MYQLACCDMIYDTSSDLLFHDLISSMARRGMNHSMDTISTYMHHVSKYTFQMQSSLLIGKKIHQNGLTSLMWRGVILM